MHSAVQVQLLCLRRSRATQRASQAVRHPKASKFIRFSRVMCMSDWLRADTPGTSTAAHFNAAGAALPTQQVRGVGRAGADDADSKVADRRDAAEVRAPALLLPHGGLHSSGLLIPESAAQVLDVQKAYLDSEATIGGYEATVEHAAALRRPYEGLAALLNCDPDEIAIVQSATTAWQQAFFGLDFREGDRILTSVHEYATNYINFLQACRRYGARIEVVPETEDGDIDVAELERMIKSGPKPKLVAVSHIATNSGRAYDAAAVGRMTRRHGIPYLLDACQSIGQLPLDVAELGCDWLSGTSRKYLRGPRGIGFLYASRDIMSRTEPAMLDMWGGEWTAREAYAPQPTARRYEQYEVAFAAKVGLGVAVQQLLDIGQQAVWDRIQLLAARLRQGLAAVPGVAVRDRGRLLCGIVSWTKEGAEPEAIKQQLRERHGIHVWVSPRSSTRIDMEARGLQACVRSSVHCYNTEEEVDRLIEAAHIL